MKSITGSMISCKAILAFFAGNMMADKNPVPYFIFFRFRLNNIPGNFMPENPRSLLDAVPLHNIGPANTAGDNLDQDLALAYHRPWHLFNADIIIFIIFCN